MSDQPAGSFVELHQHVDGSIPVAAIWELMQKHDLAPVDNIEEMRRLLALQPEEEGSLLSYLDKFHYPLWITQFYENIASVTESIIDEAYSHGVRVLELRYSPTIHTFAGLTLRQSINAVLSGMKLIARSANAKIVSDGFTPGFAEIAEPSITNRPG